MYFVVQNVLEEVLFDKEGLFHHLHKYGVTIIIPEGSVRGPATLQIGASLLLTGFKCDGSYEPVSPFVWVHTEPVLNKPAELYIPHYVMADTNDDKMKIHLLTRGHEDNAAFNVNNDLKTSISSTLVKISAPHFCHICLGSTRVPKRKYHIVYGTKEENGTVHVDVCVAYSHYCSQVCRVVPKNVYSS